MALCGLCAAESLECLDTSVAERWFEDPVARALVCEVVLLAGVRGRTKRHLRHQAEAAEAARAVQILKPREIGNAADLAATLSIEAVLSAGAASDECLTGLGDLGKSATPLEAVGALTTAQATAPVVMDIIDSSWTKLKIEVPP